MRNTILGAVLAIWGAAILAINLLGNKTNHGGSYGAGQTAALIFAVILIVAGVRAVRKGLQTQRD
jgi:peptidoglycan/LPS O-acetylase OafA/YrhL